MGRKLTIGDLSRRTGVPVKTLRFYADEGLLPPLDRSRSGYRLFGEEHAVRIDLIRALRETGIGLDVIGKLLRRDIALGDVLRLRLHAVESHIAGLQRIAAALRVAIESGATEAHLRKITMATLASHADRRKLVVDLYERVAAGAAVDRAWIDAQIEASTPPLPDEPTPQQVEAWIELDTLMRDPSLVLNKRANAVDFSPPKGGPDLFHDTFFETHYVALMATADARGRDVAPQSAEARAIIERLVTALTAVGKDDAASVREYLRQKYDPSGARYWELIAILRGGNEPPQRYDDWRWLGTALKHHAPD